MGKRDVIVIGGGPAGYVAAIRASHLGARVLLVEKESLGGTCLHSGCVPTKSLLRGVEVLELVRRSKLHGITTGEVSIDFVKMRERKDMVIRTLLSGLQGLIKANAIEVAEGKGELISANEVEVETEGENRRFQTRRIILAPGSSATFPPIPGAEGSRVITTNEIFQLTEVPESMAIIGAGASGVEFATIFARLGSKVTLIEMLPHIIPTEDKEIAVALERPLRKIGVQIFTGSRVEEIEDGQEDTKAITLKTEKGRNRVVVRLVLIATGRRPNTAQLGLERAGIRLKRGAIATNERMETSIPGIYAAGDAVGEIMLAHVASAQGKVAAENALGKDATMDYRAVPRCIYTVPEVGAVGLTEREAMEKGYSIKIGRFPLAANSKALIMGEREGFIKIISATGSGKILGINILSPQATELVAAAALAVKMNMPLKDIISTIHAHPTLNEAIKEAALDTEGEAIHIPPRR